MLAMLLSRPTDVLCLGEETAHSLGLPVNATRFGLILIACVLAGAAVSFSGLVSFVGLLCPHIVRRLFGQGRHRVLLPAAALLGASFVTLCDLLSRVLFAPYEIPVGILLSFLGGPFFLFLIDRDGTHPQPRRRRVAYRRGARFGGLPQESGPERRSEDARRLGLRSRQP